MMKPEDYLKRHKELTAMMYEISRRKNSDYTAGSVDAFANFKLVEKLGITSAEIGFLTRMTDKISRLAGLSSGKEVEVKDEKYTDTLLDLANYCLLFCIFLEERNKVVSGPVAVEPEKNPFEKDLNYEDSIWDTPLDV